MFIYGLCSDYHLAVTFFAVHFLVNQCCYCCNIWRMMQVIVYLTVQCKNKQSIQFSGEQFYVYVVAMQHQNRLLNSNHCSHFRQSNRQKNRTLNTRHANAFSFTRLDWGGSFAQHCLLNEQGNQMDMIFDKNLCLKS